MKLFNKREGSQQQESMSTSEMVAEIHETFATEVDRLLEEAQNLKPTFSDKQAILDKAKRLRKLGFTSTKTVHKAQGEEERISEIQRDNEEKEILRKAILHFQEKYPLYKFISEDSVKKICKKYGLVYGSVDRYQGDVPDKNLKAIEKFQIKEEDACYLQLNDYGGEYYIDHKEYHLADNLDEDDERYYSEFIKCPLEIAAPAKDFDLSNSELRDHSIKNIREIPDPIVLQPVFYKGRNDEEGKKGYLIVTAWGEEAGDEEVINPIMN